MNEKQFSLQKLWKDLGPRRWLFLLIIGLLLVVLAIPTGTNSVDTNGTGVVQNSSLTGDGQSGDNSSYSQYEEELEKRLTELLSVIEGAGKTEVMFTLQRSSELVLQSDTTRQESLVQETDAQGGTRNNSEIHESSQTVMSGSGTSSQPYVVGEIMPKVEGVVVACEGGDRASVQAEISAAVQALFDLQPHKIKVCKMASK